MHRAWGVALKQDSGGERKILFGLAINLVDTKQKGERL